MGDIVTKKLVLAAVFLAAAAHQPGWAAGKSKADCYSQKAIEAEEAIRFMTDIMVSSSACQNTAAYADFRVHNRDAILEYQKALIAHFHGKDGFDRWNTSLANTAAQKQGAMPAVQFCEQAKTALQQAGALTPATFRAYAVQQAIKEGPQFNKCGK